MPINEAVRTFHHLSDKLAKTYIRGYRTKILSLLPGFANNFVSITGNQSIKRVTYKEENKKILMFIFKMPKLYVRPRFMNIFMNMIRLHHRGFYGGTGDFCGAYVC